MQLAALLPCACMTIYLFLSLQRSMRSLAAALYFLSLSSLFLPALEVWVPSLNSASALFTMHQMQLLLPPLSFLLIIQCVTGKPPPGFYWLILTISIGGGPFAYLSIFDKEVCIEDACASSEAIWSLYKIFSASLVFMLLMALLPRLQANKHNHNRKLAYQRYWMVMMMIIFHLTWLILLLVHTAGYVDRSDFLFVRTMLGIVFLYLVFTSVFRVFTQRFVPWYRQSLSQYEQVLLKRIHHQLENEHIYKESDLGREQLAKRIGTSEHVLSKIVNQYYGFSVNRLINHHRIEEAKQELTEMPSKSITDVAYDAGFSSLTTFNRAFQKHVGCNATLYRKLNNASSEQPT